MGVRKAFTTGVAGGLAAAPSANPFLIGAATIGGGIVGALQDDNPFKFDPNPFRDAFQRTARTTRRRARRSGAEVRNSLAASMAAKGLGGEFSESVSSGQERAVRQRADDWLDDREAELEDNIAHAEAWTDQANRAEEQKDWSSLGNAVTSTAFNVATTDSPLRKALGIGDKDESGGSKDQMTEGQPPKNTTVPTQFGKVQFDAEGKVVTPETTQTTQGTDASMSAGLTANSSKEEIKQHITQHKIHEGSRLGKMYMGNPQQMGLLEQAFGAQWLIDAFQLP